MAPIRPSIISDGAMMSAAGFRLQHRGFGKLLDGLVVDDDAVAQDAVMAVAGEGIERHIGDDADLRQLPP